MADQPKPTVLTKDFHKPTGLSFEQRKKVRDWLTYKWGPQRGCPMCGAVSWQIGGYMVQPETLFTPDPQLTREQMDIGYQFVPVFCKNCGHTEFLNAVIVGLLPRG